jgi:hypothetical protein
LIARKRHEEATTDGKYLYIVETFLRDPATLKIDYTKQSKFTGRRLGVNFVNGKGKTKHRNKAIYFSGVLEYRVSLNKEDKPWIEIDEDGQKNTETLGDDDELYLTEEEIEDDESVLSGT